MYNKKAQGMPMNVIIISIIVLVVLVILIAFFAGGFGSIVSKVRNIFNPVSAQERDLALQTCQSYCDTALTLSEDLRTSSAYCKSTFMVDHDSDPQTKPVKMSCASNAAAEGGSLEVACPGVEEKC